jgi:hypothetical protein
VNGSFADELLGCLFGRERRRVEPPPDVAEIVFHVRFEVLITIELEPLVGVATRVAMLTNLHPGREDHEAHGPRRHEGE